LGITKYEGVWTFGPRKGTGGPYGDGGKIVK